MVIRRIFICVLAVGLSPLLAGMDTSPSGDEHSRQLEQVRSHINTLEAEKKTAEGKLDALTEELKSSELAIAKASKQLDFISRAVHAKAGALEDLKRTKQAHWRSLEAQKASLAKQIRLAYLMHRQDHLKLLLNQEDPFLIGRGLAYHSYYSRPWTQRIAALKEKLKEMDSLEQLLQLQSGEIEQLHHEQQTKLHEIEAYRNQRRNIIVAFKEQITSHDQELEALRDQEQRIEALIRSIARGQGARDKPPVTRSAPFGKLKGKLLWPSRGRITQRYGSPKKAGSLKWEGVFIEAEPGTAIQAVSAGRVVFADWFANLGLLVIIDHGEGFMTLYGHNQALYVAKENWIKAGDIIASIGDSGGNTVSGLYFEIRHLGVPLNPLRWCQRLERAKLKV